MKDAVLIKGNQHGLSVVIEPDTPFQDVKEAVRRKMSAGRQFFGNAQVTLTFEGKSLEQKEKEELLGVIQENSQLEIICLVDEDERRLAEKMLFLKAAQKEADESGAIFYNKTLRSGQELETDRGVVILGDVNNGAKISAGGNVVVLGNLKGFVHAGTRYPDKAFVVALHMQPMQIRIGQVMGRSPDSGGMEKTGYDPKIAFVEDDRIVIEQITNTIYKELGL
ncbi:septum site-determining protein MinC [Anaerotalea alkaliphila]|uniref:Probable septum site-determining protein MinC n=1 Tax=Anaerotalea alkaliphila TaxID=2662126 RepID=A0A7X5HWI0_9FIRM|nr:septum site-determining protein MinC [Anaerotalea alkaliphila]NDL67947.1 septum site-determining protein MinC [Anaerotalea alkaliphila]